MELIEVQNGIPHFLVGGNLEGLVYCALNLYLFSLSWNMPEIHLIACQEEKKMTILS